jgi:hypothetical protein
MTSQNQTIPTLWRFGFGMNRVIDLNGDLICQCFGNTANDYLIRTAPELLHALKKLVAECELAALEADDGETPWLDTAREAILRAELHHHLTPQQKEYDND